jgi:hypothetical protein
MTTEQQMTSDERQGDEPPEIQLAGDGPPCGKFVARDGDQELYCDLPQGHPDTTPCSASLQRHTV